MQQVKGNHMAQDGPGRGITGYTALVTGGGSGIGLGTARRLVADGAHVTICSRTEEKLRAATDELTAVAEEAGSGGSAQYAVADVTVGEQVAGAVEAAAHRGRGRLDILFANAGGSIHLGPLPGADLDQVRATVELNLIGTVATVTAAAALMGADVAGGAGGAAAAGSDGSDGNAAPVGGSIIGMSSGAGHFVHRNLWAYGMAKAGIDMFCRYAAEELGERGIRVNTVRPGIIDDELMSFITAGGPLFDDYLAQTPIRRAGTVEDVAEAVRFLAGPESAWITGECLAVDGGHHLRRGADYRRIFGDLPADG